MIARWRTEDDDGLREYYATEGGIDFHIVHALDGSRHSFGLTARRGGEQLTRDIIDWCDTVKACKLRAERLLAEHGAKE